MDKVILMSEEFKKAVRRTSQSLRFKTKTRNKESGTINDFDVVLGPPVRRKRILKDCRIPGSKLCMWLADSPISSYWYPNAVKLASVLGVPESKAFDREEEE